LFRAGGLALPTVAVDAPVPAVLAEAAALVAG
jgi:hypothetical protein